MGSRWLIVVENRARKVMLVVGPGHREIRGSDVTVNHIYTDSGILQYNGQIASSTLCMVRTTDLKEKSMCAPTQSQRRGGC